MSEANITMLALGYAALLVIIAVGYVVKTLFFTWEVERDGDEIEVSRLFGDRHYRYAYNVKTKNQTLYSYKDGIGRKYYADWNGKVQEVYVAGEKGVLTREEFSRIAPIQGMHPRLWKFFDEKDLIENQSASLAEIYDIFFKTTISCYRLREVAMDYLGTEGN